MRSMPNFLMSTTPDEEGLARRYSDEAGSSFSYAHPRQAVIFGISIRVLFWSMMPDFVMYDVFRTFDSTGGIFLVFIILSCVPTIFTRYS
jgi:hypothetical protein